VTRSKYPIPHRLVCYTDPKTGKAYEFITNKVMWAAVTISSIYNSRMQI